MKKIIKFLEENSKWIVRLFVIIGLFLIAKLFWFSGDFICGGGGFIDLCIVPKPEYYWINSSTISLIFFVISLLLIVNIKITKNKIKKVILSFLIFLMGLVGKQIFFLVSPDFQFYYTDKYLEYLDKDSNIKDIDLYLEDMGKYCNESKDDFKYKRVGRDTLCNGKYLYDLKTVENYKKVFDYANKNNMRTLYSVTFEGARKFGLEKIIKEYNDDTFYGYIMNYTFNLDILNDIYNQILNKKIKKILDYEIKQINFLKSNNEKYNQYESEKKWSNLSNDIDNQLYKISTINTKIF